MKIARTLLIFLMATAAFAQATGEDRLQAYIQAFNSGSAETLEAFTQANFAPAALQRRTAEERRAMFEQMWGSHGKLEIVNVRNGPDGLQAEVRDSHGEILQFRVGIEPAPPHRITGFGINIGGGERLEGPPLPPLTLPKTNFDAELDAYIKRLPGFSGSVLVAKDGKVLFEKAYGLADRDKNVPNKTSTRFNVGSITKMLTKTAIGQLAQAGKLKPDVPIATYLPNYPNEEAAQKITVQQLVDHTSGLGDIFTERYRESAKKPRTIQEHIDFFASDPLQFEPGKGRRYANYGYVVLGAIVQAASGQDYYEYIRKNVLGPAGMKGSGFFDPDKTSDVAKGYSNREPNAPRTTGLPAGGSYSTARDLLNFDRAMRSGKLLDAKTTRWFYLDPNGVWTAAGGFPGVNAVVSSNPEWTVVVLTNLDPPLGEKFGEALLEALR